MPHEKVWVIYYDSARTVRYALNRLKSEDFLEIHEHYLDSRQCLYLIRR